MKKIRITENELVDLIEKLVKENLSNGTGFDFGMVGTPTSKYKDLYENDDVEGEEELDEDEFNVDTAQTGDKTLNVNLMKQTNQTDWMGENKITESQLVRRLSRKLNEETTVGCANKPAGCIRKGSYTHTDEDTGKKTTYPWHILNNKEDGIWRGCSSEENCKEQLAAIHV